MKRKIYTDLQMLNKIFSSYQPYQLVKRWNKTNVSRTISVLVLRVLMCLKNQSVSYIYLPEFHVHDGALANGSCWFLSRAWRVRLAFWLDSLSITGCQAWLNMRPPCLLKFMLFRQIPVASFTRWSIYLDILSKIMVPLKSMQCLYW
jgi:hypothetical protein